MKQAEPTAHLAKAEKEWNESYYFVFFERRLNLGGMTRLGFKPNKQEGTTFFILFLPDRSAGLYTAVERITDDVRKKELKAGVITHESSPSGIWKYRFEGKMIVARNPELLPQTKLHPEFIDRVSNVTMDLRLSPINDVYEYSENMTPESRELGKKSGDAHWEQIGKIEGQIRIENETFHIHNAIGQRDHTHGVRDWTGIGDWLYYVVWFSESLSINPAAIIAEDGRISSGGFIFENGKNTPIKSIRVISQRFRDNVFPVSSKIEITDATNRSRILEGRTGPIVPMPFTDEQGKISILTQSFGHFTFDGHPNGYGSFETLRRMR